MPLPIKTIVRDVDVTSDYLVTKATGATIKEAASVIGTKPLDGRKLSALNTWGLLDREGDRIKVTDRGRRYAKGDEHTRASVLQEIIGSIPPYRNIVERAAHQGVTSVTAADVGAQWHEHFTQDVAEADKTINAQAVCFFHLAQGADLGTLTIGRKGNPTRFDFRPEAAQAYVGTTPSETDQMSEASEQTGTYAGILDAPPAASTPEVAEVDREGAPQRPKQGQAMFIAHGKDREPLEQLKKILDEFNIDYRTAMEEPHLGRLIGAKVPETMQECNCAILIFSADQGLTDEKGKQLWRPSENVVYELGVCRCLYGNRIIILKDERIDFPANFQDMGYIEFSDGELEAKAMAIVKELFGLGIVKVAS